MTTSKHLKNRATSAKRTATALRQLGSETHSLAVADIGVLLTAAAIVERIAAKAEADATTKKAAEQKYQRDHKAALEKIKPAVEALATETTLQKVAMARCKLHFTENLTRSLGKSITAKELKWDLEYWSYQAKSDICADGAYYVATGKTTVDKFIEDVRGKYNDVIGNPMTASIAQRFDTAIASLEQAA